MKGTSFNYINYYKYTYPFFKNFAFAIDPEIAHELTIHAMKGIGKFLPDHEHDIRFNLTAMGLNFSNPIGLAAGLDKNGEAISFMTHLPFGFVEIGTVTPRPQLGNEKPRLFRYPKEQSLRNCMGFNNFGSTLVLKNLLESNRRNKVVGVNLGKNKNTENDNAANDYSSLYKDFSPYADYLVVNVSSPNTPGLRDLLKDTGLRSIFEALDVERKILKRPLLVKVSPDMELSELASVVGLVNEYKLDGIIATNTTIIPQMGAGGVSGLLLNKKARETRAFLLKEIKNTHSKAEIIGVGGITHFSDLMEFWKLGGRLAQIYTSFVFQGPGILYEFENQLKYEFKSRGTNNFEEFLDHVKRT